MNEKNHNPAKQEELKKEGPESLFQYHNVLVALLALLVIVTAFNQFQILTLYSMPLKSGTATASSTGSVSNPQSATNSLADVDVLPKGTPLIYGPELGINYDDITGSNPTLTQQTIAKLAQYDDGIVLQGGELARYVKIGTAIACEYCCGAKTLIFSNGQAACGCAHSYAMRGLAKYLIKNHGSEYTDDQILEELGKWKTLFFPGPLTKKAAVLQSQGIELNYINLASNKYRGAESGTASSGSAGASQVGGC